MKMWGWKFGLVGLSGVTLTALALIHPVMAETSGVPADRVEAEQAEDSDHRPLAGPRGRGGRPPREAEDCVQEGEIDEEDRSRRFERGKRSRRSDFMGPSRRQVSKEMVERVMEVLESELPEWHERLADMRQNDPERFSKVFRRIFPMVREYVSLREHDPEIAETVIEEFKIEHRLRELSRRYQAAEADAVQRSELDATIEELVRRQFELRMKRRRARLDEVEQRLQRQREKYEADMANQDAMISKRIERVKQGKFKKFRSRGKRSRAFDEHPRGRPDDDGRRPPRQRRPGRDVDEEEGL